MVIRNGTCGIQRRQSISVLLCEIIRWTWLVILLFHSTFIWSRLWLNYLSTIVISEKKGRSTLLMPWLNNKVNSNYLFQSFSFCLDLQTLSVLHLGSNKISDEGVHYVTHILETNIVNINDYFVSLSLVFIIDAECVKSKQQWYRRTRGKVSG